MGKRLSGPNVHFWVSDKIASDFRGRGIFLDLIEDESRKCKAGGYWCETSYRQAIDLLQEAMDRGNTPSNLAGRGLSIAYRALETQLRRRCKLSVDEEIGMRLVTTSRYDRKDPRVRGLFARLSIPEPA